MNPTDPINNDNRHVPSSPPPIVGSKTMAERFDIKIMLPRLIVAAIVINILPDVVGTMYPPFAQYAQTVQMGANILFIIVFLITIFFQLKGSRNAQNRP